MVNTINSDKVQKNLPQDMYYYQNIRTIANDSDSTNQKKLQAGPAG